MKNIKINKIRIILLISIILVLVVGVSTTIAVLKDNSEDVTNTFYDPSIEIYIEEIFFDDVKSDVYVTNNSDVPMYIRAVIVSNYKNSNGEISSDVPVSNIENPDDYDYTLILGTDDWVKGSDGYYYYIYPVDIGDSTSNLIDTATTENKQPVGFGLSIEIMASAIQAEPKDAVLENWSSGVSSVDSNGTLTIK